MGKKFHVSEKDIKIPFKPILGSYNVAFPLNITGNTPNLILRIAIPASARFPDEKTVTEVTIARFLRQNTFIPTPEVFHYSLSPQHPDFNAFIIIERIEGDSYISNSCTKPNEDLSAAHVLDLDLPKSKLRHLDIQVASHLLELLQHRFPRIGSLVQTGRNSNSYSVQTRPGTHPQHKQYT